MCCYIVAHSDLKSWMVKNYSRWSSMTQKSLKCPKCPEHSICCKCLTRLTLSQISNGHPNYPYRSHLNWSHLKGPMSNTKRTDTCHIFLGVDASVYCPTIALPIAVPYITLLPVDLARITTSANKLSCRRQTNQSQTKMIKVKVQDGPTIVLQ